MTKVKTILIGYILLLLCSLFLFSCSNTKSKKIKIGDTISFGRFQWLVLDLKDDQALIISKGTFGEEYYHHSNIDISYAESSIREYLMSHVYLFFNAEDRSRMIETTNENLNNQWYGTSGGEATIDKIFLLSISEVVRYFGDSGKLDNRPEDTWFISDDYNEKRIALTDGEGVDWWLRSPGETANYACFVTPSGVIVMEGVEVNYPLKCGIRPALWLKL